MLIVKAAYIAIYTVAALIARASLLSRAAFLNRYAKCFLAAEYARHIHSGLASLERPNLGYLADATQLVPMECS